jgi:hypothetical protein
MPKYTMSDGRAFTDYHASCTLNQSIQNKYQLTNSHDYRYFLQKNGEQLQKDLAVCEPEKECTICPVCAASLEYKPKQTNSKLIFY